ncbi:MAG: translation initiation factor IF-2 [Desulfobacterota bacterium]|nr:translation initiation factor IF-2 [Thermodesulfobacteriota bacterium]
MGKVKVLDLASEVGVGDDKLLKKLKQMGVKVKEKKAEASESPSLPSDERIIEKDDQKEVVEKRIKPTVIRRRTRSLEVQPQPSPPPTLEAPAPPAEPHAEPPSAPPKEPARPKAKPSLGEEKAPEATKKEAKKEVKKEVKKEEKPEGAVAKPERTEPPVEKVVKVEGEVTGMKVEIRDLSQEKASAEEKAPAEVEAEKEVKKAKKTLVEEKGSAETLKKLGAKFLTKEELLQSKKIGVLKKRKQIEERRIQEEDFFLDETEDKKPPEVEPEIPTPRPFKPVKKKLVVQTSQKPEITVPKPIKRIIRISEAISVGDLAKRMGVKGSDVIKKLMDIGVMATINQMIDPDVASLAASEFGYEVERVSIEQQEILERKEDRPEDLRPRPPVVTIMGHVDHGKTMLLDAIRKTNVVEGEAGGITQHIGAYDVHLDHGRVVFIDTPGHEAFTAMRARGAQVTDVVVLVVAADDGVMPQTKEAIDHARAAKVPIVVAINKIDKPNANPEKVKKELSELGLVPEQWGGTTLFAEISAKQKIGIKELLELILLQAEILELKANPNKPARGVVIESKLDKGRGPVATVLIQEGTLRPGDVFLAGAHYGKVRAMLNDKGQKMDEAGPSTPVEVLGFSDVPEAGEAFIVVPDERIARQISLYRQEKIRSKELAKLSKVSLEELYEKIKKGEIKELNVVLKADVQGSIEAMKEALKKLSTDEVKVNIIHDGVGGITETDVNLASASNAVIIGFNVRPVPKAQALAEQEKVDLRTYSVIYDAISDIKKAMEGLLEPTYREHILGRAQVLQLFNIRKVGVVAGSIITDGKVVRGSHARLLRDNVVIYNGKISSLRRFKDDMKECTQGLECGIWMENFNDIKPGDIIESYEMEEVRPRLT